jgi:DNA-binding XRE family transcriptional regulator
LKSEIALAIVNTMKIRLLPQERKILEEMGIVLREARLARGEPQDVFGGRIGVSRQTLAKMEKGDPATSMGAWIKASAALGRLGTWNQVLKTPSDPFAEYDRAQERFERVKKARARRPKR